MDKPLWMWGGFFGIVITLLIFDLGLLNRKDKELTVRGSLWLSLGYVIISLCFGCLVMHFLGSRAAKDFFTGYCIEKSLSMDNIFVISMVFTHFATPRRYQRRVLYWGILGVVLLRGLMIGVGGVLIQQFHAVLYLFGAFLIVTGFRMIFMHGAKEKTIEENKVLAFLRAHIPVTAILHGKRFFAREAENGQLKLKATPLLLVLLFIELADVVFAVDSVPAVFAVTTDPFIVFTSNVFAILGLRALYFAFSAMLHRFAYLKYALALVLIFIGGKIFLSPYVKITSGWSLSVTLLLLFSGVLVSLHKTRLPASHAARL